ncbi:MAG TPA: ANTAR domain-containing protein, partial [Mycobacteriales bacterium]
MTASAHLDSSGSASDDQLRASLQDRLAFSQATSLLVGLTGCTPERAADALRTIAGQLDIHPARIAPLFLEHVMALDDEDSEAFVARLEDAARDTGTNTQHPAGPGRPERSQADQSGGRGDLAAHAHPSPGPAGAWSSTPSSPQLTATPILAGDLRGVT